MPAHARPHGKKNTARAPRQRCPTPVRSPGWSLSRPRRNWRPCCSRLAKHPFVTVDTEFLRETTYFPHPVRRADGERRRSRGGRRAGRRARPCAVLQADGEREGAEGVSRGAPGHRDRLASRQDHSASGVRHPGRRHGARLWRLHLLRPAGAAHHRRRARQVAPFHRLVAPAADRGATQIRGLRRDASARRLSDLVRRHRQAQARRMGRRGDGRADLARHLPHGAGAAPGSG